VGDVVHVGSATFLNGRGTDSGETGREIWRVDEDGRAYA
jgi:hypothetical protein